MKYCKWCRTNCRENGLIMSELFCPTCIRKMDYRDAAKFEARVVIKIAQMYPRYTCTGISTCKRFSWDKSKRQCRYAIEDCVIWKARLAVEAEMDKE